MTVKLNFYGLCYSYSKSTYLVINLFINTSNELCCTLQITHLVFQKVKTRIKQQNPIIQILKNNDGPRIRIDFKWNLKAAEEAVCVRKRRQFFPTILSRPPQNHSAIWAYSYDHM